MRAQHALQLASWKAVHACTCECKHDLQGLAGATPPICSPCALFLALAQSKTSFYLAMVATLVRPYLQCAEMPLHVMQVASQKASAIKSVSARATNECLEEGSLCACFTSKAAAHQVHNLKAVCEFMCASVCVG